MSLLLVQPLRRLLLLFIDHKMNQPSMISATTRTTRVRWILQKFMSRRLALKDKTTVKQVNPRTKASTIKNLRSPLRAKIRPMLFTETLRHRTRQLSHPHLNQSPLHPPRPFPVHGPDSNCLRHPVIYSLHQHKGTRRNTTMTNTKMTC